MKKIFFSKIKTYSIFLSFLTVGLITLLKLMNNTEYLPFLGILFILSTWWIFFHLYLMISIGNKLLTVLKNQEDPFSSGNSYSLKEIARRLKINSFESFIVIDLLLRQKAPFVSYNNSRPFVKRKWTYCPKTKA